MAISAVLEGVCTCIYSHVERRRSYCPGITISMRDIGRSSNSRQIKLRWCVLHGIRACTTRSKVFDHLRRVFTRPTFLLCASPSYFHAKRDFIFSKSGNEGHDYEAW